MKKLIIAWSICFIGFMSLLAVFAYGDTLTWTPPADSIVNGYKVYYNEYSKDVGPVVDVLLPGDLNLVPGLEYTFTVTAYNDADESGPSNSVTWTRPMFAPSDNPAPVTLTIPGPVTITIGGE